MRIGVSLVSYNRLEELHETLSSLHRALGPEDGIWVHDNASSSSEALAALQCKFPDVRWTLSSENLGFGAGHHANLEQMRPFACRYTFLLNPDLRLEPEHIDAFLDASRQCEDRWILGPLLVQEDVPDPLLDSAGLEWDRWFRSLDRWQGRRWSDTPLAKSPQPVIEVPGLCGAALWIPSALISQETDLPIFSPEYFAYGEDLEFSLSWRFRGGRLGLVPKAWLVHRRGGFGRLKELDAEDWKHRQPAVRGALLNRYRTIFRHASKRQLLLNLPGWLAYEIGRWGYIALRKPFLMPLLLEVWAVFLEERRRSEL